MLSVFVLFLFYFEGEHSHKIYMSMFKRPCHSLRMLLIGDLPGDSRYAICNSNFASRRKMQSCIAPQVCVATLQARTEIVIAAEARNLPWTSSVPMLSLFRLPNSPPTLRFSRLSAPFQSSCTSINRDTMAKVVDNSRTNNTLRTSSDAVAHNWHQLR